MNHIRNLQEKWFRTSTVFLSFPEGPKLRGMREYQSYKSSLQKTHSGKNFSGDGKEKNETFSSRRTSQKSLIVTTHWNLMKPVKNYHGIIVHLRLTVPRQMLLLRAVRRIEEGTSAVLLQSGLDEKCWADSMECYCNLRNVEDLSVRRDNTL